MKSKKFNEMAIFIFRVEKYEKYEKDGKIKRENRKLVAYKVHKEHVKFLLDEIKKNKIIMK